MKGLTPQEKRETLSSFFVDDDEPLLAVVDRSTLERYATCPASARLVESGLCIDSSAEAESGNAVHDAIANGLHAWIDTGGSLSPSDVRGEIESALYGSRPDIQPDAIRGLRAALYGVSRLIAGIHPQNVLAYDGGEGDRSGQLAIDLPSCGVRATSEIDLLYATPAKDVLAEVDWKSGHKYYSIGAIRDSFQFGMHAVLVFEKYPECKALQVSIYHTRTGRRQWAVEFRRDDLAAFRTRLMTAAGKWFEHHAAEPFSAPTWPTAAKCNLCPAAAICPAANRTATVAANPTLAVDNRIVLAEALASVDEQLTAYVKQYGPVRGSQGELYGVKPPSGRAIYGVYSEAGEREPTESDDASDQPEGCAGD